LFKPIQLSKKCGTRLAKCDIFQENLHKKPKINFIFRENLLFFFVFIHIFLSFRDFTEFGGVKGNNHKGFLPTGEMLMYILAGANLEL
jgi:hypothetical protein